MPVSKEMPLLISLQELKLLGCFPRCQDIDKLLAKKLPPLHGLFSYPLFKTRLPPDPFIDVMSEGRWMKVKFSDDIDYYIGQKGRKYFAAPAGYYTDNHIEIDDPGKITLNDSIKTIFTKREIKDYKIVDIAGPYLTFDIKWFDPNASWVDEEDMHTSKHVFHAADPRISIDGKDGKEPWFNDPIAVSHRWLNGKMPDPDGLQYTEFLQICGQFGLHDSQTFLFDYCSLPQLPRTKKQEEYFRKQLPIFQEEFTKNAMVLNEGSADYKTRAWCMLELMLAGFRNSIINHASMHEGLAEAYKMAQGYVTQAGWSNDSMQKHFIKGLTLQTYNVWSKDFVNVAIYNKIIDARNEIEKLFEKELVVTNETDRPIIQELLQKLCFARV